MEVVTEKSKAVVLPGYIAAVTPEDIQEEAVTPEPTVDLSDMVGEYSTEEVDFVVEEMKDRINEAEGKVDEEQVLGADDLMLIPQQDVFGLYPDVEIGAIIELEGYPIEVIDVEGDSFVLKSIPVVEESPEKAAIHAKNPENIAPEGKTMAKAIIDGDVDGMKPIGNAEERLAEAMVSPFKSTDPLPLSHIPDSITETKVMSVDEALETYPEHAPEIAEAAGVDLDLEEDQDWEKLEKAGVIKPVVESDVEYTERVATIEGEPEVMEPDAAVEEAEMLKAEEIMEKLDDPIRTAISQEIFDLYGTMQEYDYKLEDGQYNVTLKTGEVVVLLQSEIDRQVGI